jgi:predicted CXXCH cytochrome family protein
MAEESNCVTCHQSWEDDTGPSYLIERDVHFQKGLGCVDCHGGDASLEDMDEVRETKSYRGVPDHLDVPEFCARCHSNSDYMRNHNPSLPIDQLEKYKTSIHGERLYGKNDKKVANCVSCHSVHQIASAKLPYSTTYPKNLPSTCATCHANKEYMAEYRIPTSQYDDYVKSVHGKALLEHDDLGAPACNDCHGNHGASPPGVKSLAFVCGVCHAIEAELFEKSPHYEAFTENDFPMCETCHSNHDIEKPDDHMIGMDDPGLCGNCHSVDDGTRAPFTADSMSYYIGDLRLAAKSAHAALKEAQEKGMMTTDVEFVLKEVDQALIQSRTAVHAFNLDSLVPKAETGIARADSVKTMAASLVDEYFYRRRGLVVATLLMTFLAILLYVKIRKIERG